MLFLVFVIFCIHFLPLIFLSLKLLVTSLAAILQTYVFSLRIHKPNTAMAQIFAFQFLAPLMLLMVYISICMTRANNTSEGRFSFTFFFCLKDLTLPYILYHFIFAGLATIHKATAKLFCALSPSFSLGFCILTLLNFIPPYNRNGGSWFQFNILGFSVLMFVMHIILWYPFSPFPLSRSPSFPCSLRFLPSLLSTFNDSL